MIVSAGKFYPRNDKAVTDLDNVIRYRRKIDIDMNLTHRYTVLLDNCII